MASKICPRDIPDNNWRPLEPNHDFAVKCEKDQSIFLRFGQGHGVYVAITHTPANGHLIYTVKHEDGDMALIGKIPDDGPVEIGRTGDSEIKILHAIISRRHTRLWCDPLAVTVRDLGSTNGTYCLDGPPMFDVAEYLKKAPLEGAEDRTLDWVHEQFGPPINDFLKRYSQQKDK